MQRRHGQSRSRRHGGTQGSLAVGVGASRPEAMVAAGMRPPATTYPHCGCQCAGETLTRDTSYLNTLRGREEEPYFTRCTCRFCGPGGSEHHRARCAILVLDRHSETYAGALLRVHCRDFHNITEGEGVRRANSIAVHRRLQERGSPTHSRSGSPSATPMCKPA